ncbi:MAG: ATP-grasp domain-containing protein, partial [Candidatus Omnitrophica bacterium]|nr:ATP-grasp domain-containing protein [Candidatus Omnitrophota bacterium]
IDKKDFLDPQGLKEKVNKNNPVCIFNLFEGFCDDSAKEAEFVKVLEASGIPFTGNPSAALEICLNKQKVKNILRRNKIPVPAGIFIDKTRSLDIEAFNFPLFIKPCFQDASVGIEEDCLVLKKEELLKTINSKLKRFPKGVLVEEFIDGKEYNAAFLGSFPYELLGIGKLDYQRHENLTPFLTYASKWEEAAPEFKKLVFSPCLEISDSLKDEIVGLSQRAAEALGCSGYFRVDFREKNNRLSILDVNPNPDINPDSGFISQARRKGYSYIGILEKILELKHKTSEALK